MSLGWLGIEITQFIYVVEGSIFLSFFFFFVVFCVYILCSVVANIYLCVVACCLVRSFKGYEYCIL